MGCHTWCYKRLNITDEIREEYKKQALAHVNYYLDKEYLKDASSFKDDPKFIPEMEEMIRLISSEGVAEKIQNNHIPTIMEWMCNWQIHQIEENYYSTEGTPHDPFRVYGYPEGHWYDAKSLIDFLKSYDQELIIDPDGNKGVTPKLKATIKKLFKTVDMIDFG